MNKKLFIKLINGIKRQHYYDSKCNKAFGVILPNDYISGYVNYLESTVIKVLEEIMNDKSQWIQYFIYELDFGKNYKDGMISDNIRLKTLEDLWKLLNHKR